MLDKTVGGYARHPISPLISHTSLQVLDKMVDGYATHLNVRKELAESGGGVGITPAFTDLMMWAVLAGQHELATVL